MSSPPELLFSWKPHTGPFKWILAACLTTVLVHASFFYVFHTGPGAPLAQTPPTHRVAIIDSSHPDGQRFLRDVDDYAAVYASTLERPSLDVRSLLEPGQSLDFEPSTAGRSIPLLPFEVPANPPPLRPPHPEREPVLPPPPPGDGLPSLSEGVGASFPRIRVSGDLANREIVERPQRERPEDPLELTPPATFHVGVDRSGRVLFAFPTDGAASGFSTDVQATRFAASPAAPELTWGWIRLSW